jgi:hypothetical protein
MTCLIGWCDVTAEMLLMACDDAITVPGIGTSPVPIKKWCSLSPSLLMMFGGSFHVQLGILTELWTRQRYPIAMTAATLPLVQEIAMDLWQQWRSRLPDIMASVGWEMPPEKALGLDLLIGGVDQGQLCLWLARSPDFTWQDMRNSIPIVSPDEALTQLAYATLARAMHAGADPVDACKAALLAAHEQDRRIGSGGQVLGILEGHAGCLLEF